MSLAADNLRIWPSGEACLLVLHPCTNLTALFPDVGLAQMEIISASASVAGLLTLAGQCVSGTVKLIQLYEATKQARQRSADFLADINSLLRTLHDVQILLQKIRSEASHDFHDLHMATLKMQLEDCDNDLRAWVAAAQAHEPGGRSTKRLVKSIWSTVNERKSENIGLKIQKRKADISLALTALGR